MSCVSVHEDMFMFVQSRSQFIFQFTCSKLVSSPDPPPFFVGGKSGSETSSLGMRLAENSLGLRPAKNSLSLLAENSLGMRL